MTETDFWKYFQRLQEKRLAAETFNRKVMALQHFYGFLKARDYVGQIPFHGEYYLKKTFPLHHDRSVEEQVSDEILKKLHRFPEHLRLMYLHLWGIGLRISEVCSLKGGCLLHTGTGRMDPGLSGKAEDIQADTDP